MESTAVWRHEVTSNNFRIPSNTILLLHSGYNYVIKYIWHIKPQFKENPQIKINQQIT